jgi:two-component system nitrogen regulation response regulator GlnG
MTVGSVAALTVLAHPDPAWVGGRALLRELTAGRPVEISRLAPRFLLGNGEARPLSDPYLSRRPWFLEPRSDGRLRLRPDSVVIEVDGEVASRPRDLGAAELLRGVVLQLGDRVTLLLHGHPGAPRPSLPSYGLVGRSGAIDLLRQEISRVAPSDLPVLLRGETGTGKELVARALHDHGQRRAGPWVAVNMAAIPPQLAAAELFGVEKGAFTGATSRKRGYFQRAEGGTLFLDEIGETPPDVQALLLRALENGEIQRVGAAVESRIDVRVVAATDADLDAKVADGTFRSPLLHRLAGYQIELPTLRKRREDLGLLLYHFLAEELRAAGCESRLALSSHDAQPWIGASLVARLAAHDWHGNVRELKNTARRIVAANPGAAPAVLPPPFAGAPGAPTATEAPVAVHRRKPSEVSDEEVVAVLEAENWNLKATAGSLGISRGSLYLRLESIPGVSKAADLQREEIERARAQHDGDVRAMAAGLRVSTAGLEQRMRKLKIEP